MSDITIPAEDAKAIADFLRHKGLGEYHRLVALLDPQPAPSLRDEVHAAIVHDFDHWTSRDTADAVLAVVRRHVEALPVAGMPLAGSAIVLRDEVLRVLGGAE